MYMNNRTADTPFFISKMEAEVIISFLPDLVTAVSDSVLSVSDQCLAKGLIPESVLESGGTSKEKARTLILAVKKTTETDSRCLDILLNILEQELPFAIRENLLSKIRKELTEKANTCRAVVPLSKAVQQVPLGELSKETTLQQSALLGRFEDSIRQREHACVEKKLLEERLKVLESRKDENDTAKMENKIETCTNQIESLKKRIEELQKAIEEQNMQARRGRNTIITETKKAFVQLAQQSQQEIQRREEEIQRKEEEHKAALREAEALATKKAEDEMKVKERELKVIVQEKELRIRELEVESKQRKESSESSGVIPDDILSVDHLDALYATLSLSDKEETCGSHWRDIGSQLGFSTQELDDINNNDIKKFKSVRHRIETTYDPRFRYLMVPRSRSESVIRMIEMLRRWLQWYPKDCRGSTNLPTYLSLKKALMDAGCGNILSKLWSYTQIVAEAKEYLSDTF